MKVIPFKGEHVPGAQFLQETEVTVEQLRSILETAVIDLEPDDAIYSRHIISFDGGHTFAFGEDVS